jgi:hypothetical protein
MDHLLDVSAGGEDLLASVQHDRAHVGALGGLRRGVPELVLHLPVEGVHRRPVEPDRSHPA